MRRLERDQPDRAIRFRDQAHVDGAEYNAHTHTGANDADADRNYAGADAGFWYNAELGNGPAAESGARHDAAGAGKSSRSGHTGLTAGRRSRGNRHVDNHHREISVEALEKLVDDDPATYRHPQRVSPFALSAL
jgi:hypothetical protein